MESTVKDAYWFQHDSNAQHDERVLELRAEYGWEGYGLYWALVEKMRDAPDYRLSMATLGGLAAGMGVLKPLLTGIITLSCQHGLFALEQESAYFFSPSLRRRMSQWDEKKAALSEAGKRGVERKKALKDAAALAQKQRELEATLKPPLNDPATFLSTVHNNTIEKKEEGTSSPASQEEPAAEQAEPTPSKSQTPAKVISFAEQDPDAVPADECRIFEPTVFASVLKDIGYAYVDHEHYRRQILADVRDKNMLAPARTFRKYITTYLNNDKLAEKLMLPSEHPIGAAPQHPDALPTQADYNQDFITQQERQRQQAFADRMQGYASKAHQING
ncbi:Lin1244/Lin1753 domain-containing protein [Hymenobacter sp. BT491]|uniref:Lin1244/Lin1753 domain-containing protein n=1 Tax=Hymenobacter sp. BT491 TaxID=2766779 RepID=UPI0016535551|nr:Lin1244/Lin1753 domain-containing protein [Hymenobacter sp. BT491]MBC6988968.1 DUF4373 domain-containing protein [Hymenobacter sp. BT491]